MIQQSRGFTLIELVVVILILGILSATALPRFLNVNSKAHIAAVDGAGGGFGAGVALARAGWFAQGSTAAATLTNFGDNTMQTNATGWPVGTDGTFDATADCTALWTGLMQNPPVLGASGDYTELYNAGGGTPYCTYTYNSVNTMSITYTPSIGAVAVDDIP